MAFMNFSEVSDGRTTASALQDVDAELSGIAGCPFPGVEGEGIVTARFSRPGLSLQWQGDWLVLSGGLGVVVRLDGSSSVSISVDHELQGQTQGLCGVYNGQPEGEWGEAWLLLQEGWGDRGPWMQHLCLIFPQMTSWSLAGDWLG